MLSFDSARATRCWFGSPPNSKAHEAEEEGGEEQLTWALLCARRTLVWLGAGASGR